LAIAVNLAPYRTPAWADVPHGASYAALSVAPRAGWPLVEERRLQWPLRAMSLWMAPAVGGRVREWAVTDLKCNPPTYLLVDDRQVDFSRMFEDVIAHYVPLWRRDGVSLMKLARPVAPPADRSCPASQSPALPRSTA
jgi:hypothetical protein